MRKIVTFLVGFIFLCANIYNVSANVAYDKYFIVTAYYSPLPDQKYYATGNFEAEKILQGKGIRGASGAPVFSGMLAAPQNYPFGTKIYLEGLGVGAVEDRGGAIENANGIRGHKYDRIDVWMGYGDEGLKRAMAWGKRTVRGKFVQGGVTINYKNHPAPNWAVRGLERKDRNPVPALFANVGTASKPETVKKLQKLLIEYGVYKGKIDGVYSKEIIAIIYSFQLENGIVKSETDAGAGYFGYKTARAFAKQYKNKGTGASKKSQQELTNKIDKIVVVEENLEDKKINSSVSLLERKPKNEEEEEKIYSYLDKTGFDTKSYTGERKFIHVIYDFQLQNGIVQAETDAGAGVYGPKTRSKLQELHTEIIKAEEKALTLKKAQEEKEKKIAALANKNATTEVALISEGLKKGDVSVEVRNLQKTLKKLGYLEVKDTAIFGPKTKSAVVAFQLDTGVISSDKSESAGFVGKNTLEKMKDILVEYHTEQQLRSEK